MLVALDALAVVEAALEEMAEPESVAEPEAPLEPEPEELPAPVLLTCALPATGLVTDCSSICCAPLLMITSRSCALPPLA